MKSAIRLTMSNDRNLVIARIQRAYQECLKFSSEHPDIAVNRCRKILEMMLIHNHREKQGEPDSKAMHSVDKLVDIGLKLGIISPLQGLNMRVIQTFGNFGSHFQDGAEDELCFEEIQPCIIATETLLKWFVPDIDMDVFSGKQEPSVVQTEAIDVEQDDNVRTTIRTLIHKLAKDRLTKDSDTIRLREISKWFEENHPQYSRNAVETHVGMMATNGETRLAHRLKPDGSDELFFRVKPGLYRLYRPGNDPEPIIESEQHSGWEDKLVVVNTADSFDAVRQSKMYMSPNTGGNYKLQRCKYLGIYKNKTVPYIAEVIARVSFHKSTSDGYVWWRNNHNIEKTELINLARDEVDRRMDFDYPVQVIIMEDFSQTDFKKKSPRGMLQNNRVFDITNVNEGNVSRLATLLEDISWEDLNR